MVFGFGLSRTLTSVWSRSRSTICGRHTRSKRRAGEVSDRRRKGASKRTHGRSVQALTYLILYESIQSIRYLHMLLYLEILC